MYTFDKFTLYLDLRFHPDDSDNLVEMLLDAWQASDCSFGDLGIDSLIEPEVFLDPDCAEQKIASGECLPAYILTFKLQDLQGNSNPQDPAFLRALAKVDNVVSYLCPKLAETYGLSILTISYSYTRMYM